MEKRIQSFNYSASEDAQVLILGSIPGEESLRKQQYYAHPRNLFWDFMEILLGIEKSLPYSIRLKKLRENKIALWDVVYRCCRPGSLDSSIKVSTTEPNDFISFFKTFKKVNTVFFNGKKSETLFKRFMLKPCILESSKLSFFQLPSTSPANASISKELKLYEWKKILNALYL